MHLEIENSLEERIDRVYKKAGYSTASELVRDAVRDRLNQIEARQYSEETTERPFFKYRIFKSKGYPTEVRLIAKQESVKFEIFENQNKPQTVVFDTGVSYIGADDVEKRLEQIKEVAQVQISILTGEILLHEQQNESLEPNQEILLNQIYDSLSQLFAESDRRVAEDEITQQESYHRAISPYCEAARLDSK